MKFSIEHINLRVNKKESPNKEILIKPEEIKENLERFCKEVLVKEQEIGAGNFSWVYQDTKKNGLCYKRYKPGAEKKMNIPVHSEMDFMENVYGIDEHVKTPYPLGLAEVIINNNEINKKSLVKVIAMEHFENSTRLEDVIDPKNPELKKDFPETFDVELFFHRLETFIHKMHNEKNIYHRDLFSRNILIDNETGNPIVIDFGDASRSSLDERFTPYGKPKYGNEEKEDEDLLHVASMKKEVQRILTENYNN